MSSDSAQVPLTGGYDSEVPIPQPIVKAVHMLNNLHEYRDLFKHDLDYHKDRDWRSHRSSPTERIQAKAEWLPFKNRWVLYVEWDDREPLTARSTVHKALRECGLSVYVASGCGSNYDKDAADETKFGPGAQVSYLKVAPSPHRLVYVCEDCGSKDGKTNTDISLTFNVGE